MKACIFDLDGTLCDTLESMAKSFNEVTKPLGLIPLPVENFRYYAGDGAKMLVQRALIDAGDSDLKYLEQAFKSYKEVFDVHCMYRVQIYEGILETLHKLRENHVKLAVLSNKPHEQTVKVIQDLFGDKLFDWVQGQKDGIEKKPDPSGVYAICKAFEMDPSECMYIGDTNVDMMTGNNAGAFTVGVLWGFREKEELLAHHAHALVEKPEDLIAVYYDRA